MKPTTLQRLIGALVGAALLGAGGYGLYRLGAERDHSGPSADAALKAGDVDPTTGKKVLYWHDPMVPGQRFEQPGKSPFMNMALVPVLEGDRDDGKVTVSARVQQNLGIRTAEVVRRALVPRVEVVGNIAFNERDQVIVQARATAYIERLHVRATLDRVAAGQPLADLYVPDWVAAQEEFLSVRRMRGDDLASLVDGARQRMRQAGMSDEQIRRVESSGEVQARITLTAPIGGVIVELMAREGMTVMPGDTLFRINGLTTVWANAEVPESQAGLVRPGAAVQARSPALPGTRFVGTVETLLPEVDPGTRTIKARVELANQDQALAPGMFVTVTLEAEGEAPALTVPSEAVIRTGTRTVVIVANGDGTFQPVDAEVGKESAGNVEIRRGLAEGQSVVVSGQFLIDSEANLRAASTRMEDRPAPSASAQSAPAASVEHVGEGKVTAIGPDSVTLSHEPIPTMQWGAMTMEFRFPSAGPRPELDVGEAVRFAFTMGDDGRPRLTRIEPQ